MKNITSFVDLLFNFLYKVKKNINSKLNKQALSITKLKILKIISNSKNYATNIKKNGIFIKNNCKYFR